MSEEKEQDRRVMKASEVMGPLADTAFEMRSGGTRTQWTGSSPTTAGSGLRDHRSNRSGPQVLLQLAFGPRAGQQQGQRRLRSAGRHTAARQLRFEGRSGVHRAHPVQGSWGQAYNSNWAKGIDEKAVPYGPEDWYGIAGKIRSGGDWILIQKNGVARFDARVTIESRDNVLIDAVFTGDVDLRAAVSGLTVTSDRTSGTWARTSMTPTSRKILHTRSFRSR